MIDESIQPGETRAEPRAAAIGLAARALPHAPKIGAFVCILAALVLPIFTGGEIFSNKGAVIFLIAAAGLSFAATWDEWKEL